MREQCAIAQARSLEGRLVVTLKLTGVKDAYQMPVLYVQSKSQGMISLT